MNFLVKTISNEEKEAFHPANYFHHMNQCRDSLINRVVLFASLTRHDMQLNLSLTDYARKLLDNTDPNVVHFVVLENIIPPHRNPTELYDLKVRNQSSMFLFLFILFL